jgi:hypothetical protein
LTLVVFFQATEYGIDVGFVEILAFVDGHLSAEFFGVACGETCYRRAIDRPKLAAGIVVVKNIVGRMFLVVASTIAATHDVYAIVIAIKQGVNV